MHGGIWSGVRERLARQFRLYLVDLPGHGFSPPCVPGSRRGTLDCMVDRVAEILPADCIVCGWSLGGLIAMELALRESLTVRKLALISTTPSFVKHRDWQWGMEAATLQLFAENLKRDYRKTLYRFLALQMDGGSDTTTKTMLARMRKSVFERGQPDETALEEGLQILLCSDMRGKIMQIRQRVLLFQGENDVITHPKAASWMNRQFHNSTLIMLPACGHAPFLSYPDQFTDHMIGLLDSIN